MVVVVIKPFDSRKCTLLTTLIVLHFSFITKYLSVSQNQLQLDNIVMGDVSSTRDKSCNR